MCIRQLMSVAITASAPVSSMHSSLRSSMAPDTSLIFTAKRPPNPQQVSASRSGRTSMSLTAFSSSCGWRSTFNPRRP